MQEVAEPMYDLKVGIEELRRSRTLKYILATMLSVGNFLNGSEVTCLHTFVYYLVSAAICDNAIILAAAVLA